MWLKNKKKNPDSMPCIVILKEAYPCFIQTTNSQDSSWQPVQYLHTEMAFKYWNEALWVWVLVHFRQLQVCCLHGHKIQPWWNIWRRYPNIHMPISYRYQFTPALLIFTILILIYVIMSLCIPRSYRAKSIK